ncbi:MAG: metallophosphoesterase [Candidatus Nanopelagicales bacterium]
MNPVGIAKWAALAVAGMGGLGATTFGYATWEARQYQLRRTTVVIPAHHPERRLPDLRILHLSDLHLSHRDLDRVAWVRRLGDLRPDLVVGTGDFHGEPDAADLIVRTLGSLLSVPGVFVHGSNDFFAPTRSNPLRYFAGPSQGAPRRAKIDHAVLDAHLLAAGWQALDNMSTEIAVAGWQIAARGTGDAHIRRDRYSTVAGPYSPQADLRLGVVHSPYRRVLDPLAADGTDLIMAGHTHGGQICLPWYGALVTNCDLPRQQVKGLSSWADSALHVSAGLGTSPYAAIRLACRPEATLLTVRPAG